MACSWLLTVLIIVNLSRVPATLVCIVFLVGTSLLALRVPASRSCVAGCALALLTSGMVMVQLGSHQLTTDQISTDLLVTLRITGVPDRQNQRLSFLAGIVSCESCQTPLNVNKVRLSWYGQYPEVHAGELWQLVVRLKPPASYRNPGGFDAVAWHLVDGIHARGYVKDRESARRIAAYSGVSLSAIREQAASRLRGLAQERDRLGLLQALTVGMKTDVSDMQWDLLRATGTAHLMAISGLHVGLVAGWVLIMGRILIRLSATLSATMSATFSARQMDFIIVPAAVRALVDGVARQCSALTDNRYTPFDARGCVLIASLLAACAYAALAGFGLPTRRAVLMLAVWVIAALRFRFLPPFAAWCLALIAVLCVNPLNLLSAGFWLSFGTVATLFYLHRGHQFTMVRNEQSRWRSLTVRTIQVARTHVLLGLVLLPVGAWFFQTGSLVAPLANLVAVPWVALVCVPLGLLTLLMSYLFEPAASVLYFLADVALLCLFEFLRILDSRFISALVLSLPGPLAFCLSLIALIVMLAPRGLGVRWFAVPLLLPLILHNVSEPEVDGFEVHVLDVGQGLAVLVYAGRHTLLFDTGGKVSPDLSMIEAVVVPFLQASGRRRIDTLVVSHGDEDHAFGVDDVVRRYPDVRVLSSVASDLHATHPISACVAGEHWQVGAVQFAFMHPAVSDGGGSNNRSCVLLAFLGESRVLLTGDIEAQAERQILSRLPIDELAPLSLMTAPHHGSITSSSQWLVDALRPEYVVFPAGQRNRYGFPHHDVQLRYKLAGSTSFVTGRDGAVSFIFGNEGLSRPPVTWWDSHRRHWHGLVNSDCWQQIAGTSFALRLLELLQKGKTLCGK